MRGSSQVKTEEWQTEGTLRGQWPVYTLWEVSTYQKLNTLSPNKMQLQGNPPHPPAQPDWSRSISLQCLATHAKPKDVLLIREYMNITGLKQLSTCLISDSFEGSGGRTSASSLAGWAGLAGGVSILRTVTGESAAHSFVAISALLFTNQEQHTPFWHLPNLSLMCIATQTPRAKNSRSSGNEKLLETPPLITSYLIWIHSSGKSDFTDVNLLIGVYL